MKFLRRLMEGALTPERGPEGPPAETTLEPLFTPPQLDASMRKGGDLGHVRRDEWGYLHPDRSIHPPQTRARTSRDRPRRAEAASQDGQARALVRELTIRYACGCTQLVDIDAKRVIRAVTALDCQRRPPKGHPALMVYVDKP